MCHIHASLESRGSAFEQSGWYRRLLPLLRTAHRGITVTDVAARLLAERLPKWPVRTIHNAVDAQSFLPADPAQQDPRFAYVGRLMIGKGLLDLFAALQLLGPRQRPTEMTIVGGSAATHTHEAEEVEAAALEVGEVVNLVGSMTAGEVKQTLADSQAFVLPSHFEGQPISILEAMASGLPVIVTDVGSNAEVVRNKVDGFVVPPNDIEQMAKAIETLVQDPQLRAEQGANGRARILANYDLPRLAHDLLREYRLAAIQAGRLVVSDESSRRETVSRITPRFRRMWRRR